MCVCVCVYTCVRLCVDCILILLFATSWMLFYLFLSISYFSETSYISTFLFSSFPILTLFIVILPLFPPLSSPLSLLLSSSHSFPLPSPPFFSVLPSLPSPSLFLLLPSSVSCPALQGPILTLSSSIMLWTEGSATHSHTMLLLTSLIIQVP